MEPLNSSSGGGSDILQVYAEGIRKQTETNDTIIRINLEQKMRADRNAMINSLLGQYYA